jgi:L-lactate dehydrogenase
LGPRNLTSQENSPKDSLTMTRIAVVGVGRVGGAIAYALMLGSMAKELLLIDIDVELREAQIRDLADVGYACNSRTRVRGASYRDAAQCDIIVFTAETMVTRGSDGPLSPV